MDSKEKEIVEICKNCRFSDPVGKASLCRCRHYAPHAGCFGNKACAAWPIVSEDDWCGEFEPHPQEE